MKKAALLCGLVLLTLLQASIYWNAHLYLTAKDDIADRAERIRALGRAARFFPWNDAVYFELGKALFEQGVESLGTPGLQDSAFQPAVRAFLKSLRLNPGSAATHFHLAQTLLYMGYLSMPSPAAPFEEFKNAASLTGHNSQVYFEVGKVLLSRWGSLAPDEKEFTLDILGKMLGGKDQEKLMDLLEIWYLHVQEYGVVDRVLPEDPALLRAYARFLGEKSMSIEARQRALAKAESLEFLRAKGELEEGQREFEYFQSGEAETHLQASLQALSSIRFYQDLTGQRLFDRDEFLQVRKKAALLLAKCRVEKTRSLAESSSAIEAYLELEDQVPAISEFETFIRERGLLGEEGSTASRARDFPTLAFALALDFRQNRYRDIVRAGDLLASSTIIIPEAGRGGYVRVLALIGDSYLKLDYIYEAEKFYQKALAVDPDSLENLLRIERCYNRLNNEEKAAEARQYIEGLLTPQELDLKKDGLEKGTSVPITLTCDGRPLALSLEVEAPGPEVRPLVSAFWNGRVAWEGYVEGGAISFPVTPRTGPNTLVVTAVNRAVVLIAIRLGAAAPTASP